MEPAEQTCLFGQVCSEWDKVVLDELRNLMVPIRFGLEPYASASTRGCAEIEQRRLLGRGCFGECLIRVLSPVNSHTTSTPDGTSVFVYTYADTPSQSLTKREQSGVIQSERSDEESDVEHHAEQRFVCTFNQA